LEKSGFLLNIITEIDFKHTHNMASVKYLLEQKEINTLWTITPSASVFEALELMAEKNIGALPVVENNKLVGIFSERDYARKVILKGKSSKKTKIDELMTRQVYCIPPNKMIEDCMMVMSAKHIRHLPVVDEQNQLMGILTMRDIVKALIKEKEAAIEELETYIQGGFYQ
jgi:predicted transcriptional regulator